MGIEDGKTTQNKEKLKKKTTNRFGKMVVLVKIIHGEQLKKK